MNDLQVKAKLRAGIPGKFSIGDGLYLRISNEGTAFWSLRYSINGKRREMIIGRYSPKDSGGLSLAEAKLKAAQAKAGVREGVDPLAQKKRSGLVNLKSVNQLAQDWLNEYGRRIQNPQIPIRVFKKEISPSIGELAVSKVTPLDILAILRAINETNRPTIANDALGLCKQLFSHAVKLGLIQYNPALVFTNRDAGGKEESRDRALNLEELEIIFRVLRENSVQFARENYIAFVLLIVFGVRKGELIQAKWEEFNFETLEWRLDKTRTKTGVGITIPVPVAMIPLFEELKILSLGSEYLFPNRKQNSLKPYISTDTLNHALSKLFGEKVRAKQKTTRNILGEAGIAHFVIHDLRRTCRSLLASNGVSPHVAERCLNHKLRGVESIYDRYDYFEERRVALNRLAETILEYI